ncbi:L-glutamate gamma-semialdehyde dehydrogenase [Candidatus Shikimatogenerans silvanidophilus]|uniref:L-glutamate gamma-semialdehyde dehydrogenase n=1 Tax=Candidatus Shikimatogenerans silvanidophilus TaxID=2782547 RepID=UPI001BAA0D54|nr:L-glutamate gamma-semialdehyde dehydrogenase [Candidatus Shikimatogenerans silvanidophilus]
MNNSIFSFPTPKNEKIKTYKSLSKERFLLEECYDKMYKKKIDIPQYIGGKEIFSEKKIEIKPPHDNKNIVGYWNKGNKKDLLNAIDSCLNAKKKWNKLSWENRASIFLKIADLISGPYRYEINAATMIGQSKNIYQAEIDAIGEMVDFIRFNVKYMELIYKNQPNSSDKVWNRLEYRPLEGFLLAITPFNFTAISGNLPLCMAMMGNVVIWKPSNKQIYSANILMKIFKKAGLPDGVINMVLIDGKSISDIVLNHPDFSGVHFTGSTEVFNYLWKKIGSNINLYKNYPRIVGETGGKNFIWSDNTINYNELITAIIRGAFEYQGQKCSAISRAYLPRSIWKKFKHLLLKEVKTIKLGSPRDFNNFINAVIDNNSFERIKGYIERAKKNNDIKLLCGGVYDKTIGYFIYPTIFITKDPNCEIMIEEIFGPVLTIFIYEDKEWENCLNIINNTSKYALTGSIFSNNRYIIEKASNILRNSAGNFYINDKPTGAIVGQQPFGGSRLSGTNDKSGSFINLLRWTSIRTIKENFDPDKKYSYYFMD